MKTSLVFLTTLLLSLQLRAQLTYELGAFIGVSNYAGDLVAPLAPRFDDNGLGAGVIGRVHLSPQFGLRSNLLIGTLQGDDYNYEDRMQRGFKFQSALIEVSALGEWEPFGRNRFFTDARGRVGMHNIISPYLAAGLGLAFVDYQVDFSRNSEEDQEDMITLDESVGSSTAVLALPVVLGVKFDLHRRFVFGLELGARYPFSDYLDGVSMPANKSNRDWYYFGGATVTWRVFNGMDRGRRR